MTWVGCDHTSVNNACTGTYEASGFLYPVTAAVSALYKPPGPPSDGRDNRLYPVVMGAKRGFSGASERLNALTNAAPYSDFWHCIGQIRVTGGTSASEEMPVVYVTGETYLSSLDPFCQDIDNGQDCTTNVFTDPDAYSVNMYCGVMVDNDNDGIRVEADNCPYVSNPMQHDSGSFKSDAPNGRDNVGDLCQCGEGDGDGIVSASGDGPWTNDDLQNLREHLVGTAVADFDEARCNLMDAPAESNTCDLLDALTLKQALEANPVPTGLPETCAAAGPP
jgi:hypothetical protein